MNKRYWLAYDFDFGYDDFYKWLAQNTTNIAECGESLVTFYYNGEIEQLEKSIKSINITGYSRVYAIRTDNGTTIGKFILGNGRKIHNPWDEYLTINCEEDTDDA